MSGNKKIEYEIITKTPSDFNENSTMSWKVLDLKNKNFDAILGQNILTPIGAKIDLLEKTLQVNGVKIKFNDGCPYKDIFHWKPSK